MQTENVNDILAKIKNEKSDFNVLKRQLIEYKKHNMANKPVRLWSWQQLVQFIICISTRNTYKVRYSGILQ